MLYFTGHFGYWEIQAIAFALHAEPISVVARPLDNPYLHAMLERIRTCTGNAVIYRQGGLRSVLRDLQSNRGVAMLIDQHLHSDAVSVDFFNRPAATTSALAALALAHRRTGDSGVRVASSRRPLSPDLRPPGAASRRRRGRMRFASSRSGAPTCWRCMCGAIRISWLWMHRRWRDRRSLLPLNTRHDDAGGRAPAGGFAELARRCRHGAAGHRRSPAALSRARV